MGVHPYLSLAARFFVPLAVFMTGIMWMAHTNGRFPLGPDSWPLFSDSFWALGELGRTEREVPGYVWPPDTPAWMWAASLVGLASFSVLLAAAWRRSRIHTESLLVWLISSQLLMIALVWLIFDRYVLTIVPFAIALALAGKSIQRPALAAAFAGLLGVASLVGVRDHLAYNAATWRGIEELQRMGVRDTEINGGYVVNGWLQFTHPEVAPRRPGGGLRRPWNSPEDEAAYRYAVANSPTPGTRVLKSISYARWFGRSGRVYVLECE